MDISKWFEIAVGVISVALLMLQNRIFKKQNEIFAAQSSRTAKMSRPIGSVGGLKTYWPMVTMACLLVATWAGVVYWLYLRAQPGLPPEYEQTSLLVVSYGMDTPTSCYATVDTDLLKAAFDHYRLAIACFAYDGSMDIIDTPGIEVSNLYDIDGGNKVLRRSFSPAFIAYRSLRGATGVNIATLLVPNRIGRGQFATLREARELGVKVVNLSTANSSGGLPLYPQQH